MRYTFFFIISLITTGYCLADEAPIQPVQGGCVKPVNNYDIQLQNETINLYLEQDKYHVEVTYCFKNYGEAQKVTMGFPNQTNTIYTKAIENFSAFEGTEKLEVYKKFEETDIESKDTMWTPRIFYECSDLFFKENESKTIKNTYTQEYSTNYDDSYRLLKYILTTGSLWKGNIETIKINVILKNIPENELIARNALFNENENFTYPAISFKPNGFQKNDNGFSAELTNIEPNQDIEISFPPKLISKVSASSQLESKSNRYSPEKAVDNNLFTAWVEGAKGFGKNEHLDINITPYIAGGKLEGCYKIDKIGIVNGYIKTDETFRNNNRIKKIRISKVFFMEDLNEYKEENFEFELKDQKEVQYIKFDKPQKVSTLKFTILEIYKGEKYDDSCISEIIIYPIDQ